MLGAGFQGGGELEESVVGNIGGDRDDILNLWAAQGEGACFVENDGVEFFDLL